MLRWMLDNVPNFRRDWLVVFANTGKERQETLDFVREVSLRWGVEIVWLEYHRIPAAEIPAGVFPTKKRNENLEEKAEAGETDHWFRMVDFATAARNGEPFDELLEWMPSLPNAAGRACSAFLKIRTVNRYLFSIGAKEIRHAIGIRKDEEQRALDITATCEAFVDPYFPLVESGETELGVNAFWQAQPFDLALAQYEGNCDLCFLKRLAKRVRIARERPELVAWWKRWEERRANAGTGSVFKTGQPLTRIERLARQGTIDLGGLEDDVDLPCSCAERGFAREEEEAA
jgi:hypothetical protein